MRSSSVLKSSLLSHIHVQSYSEFDNYFRKRPIEIIRQNFLYVFEFFTNSRLSHMRNEFIISNKGATFIQNFNNFSKHAIQSLWSPIIEKTGHGLFLNLIEFFFFTFYLSFFLETFLHSLTPSVHALLITKFHFDAVCVCICQEGRDIKVKKLNKENKKTKKKIGRETQVSGVKLKCQLEWKFVILYYNKSITNNSGMRLNRQHRDCKTFMGSTDIKSCFSAQIMSSLDVLVRLVSVNNRLSYRLSDHSSIFQAEDMSILKMAQFFAEWRDFPQKSHDFLGSQAAIRCLLNVLSTSMLKHECQQFLSDISDHSKINLLCMQER